VGASHKLPPSKVIYEPAIADRSITTKAGTRLSASTAPCYAELIVTQQRFPAVTFLYTLDGKPIVKTINEFEAADFSADTSTPQCTIGDSSFRVDEGSYGSGYIVSVDLPLPHAGRVRATFEWLSVESNLLQPPNVLAGDASWNMVAPRSDVSGRIEIFDRTGKSRRVVHFRGTGYHDHISGTDAFYHAIDHRHWGRVHFSDLTAVYCVKADCESELESAKLILTTEDSIDVRIAEFEKGAVSSKLGIRYPLELTLSDGEEVVLSVETVKVIESTFYHLRTISEMTLTLGDGKVHKNTGITEILAPGNMKYWLLRWFSDFTIERS